MPILKYQLISAPWITTGAENMSQHHCNISLDNIAKKLNRMGTVSNSMALISLDRNARFFYGFTKSLQQLVD